MAQPENDQRPGSEAANDEWPRPGSTFYYALRHYPTDGHARVRSTLKLIETVSECLLDVSEPTVAEQKIHWWHEEIDRLHNAEPRHPATVNFAANCLNMQAAERTVVKQSLLKLLSLGTGERFNNLTNEQEMLDKLNRDFSIRTQLIAIALDTRFNDTANVVFTENPDSTQNPLMTGLGLTHRLIRFHRYHFAGMAVWSDDLYQRFGLRPESLSREQPTAEQTKMQAYIIDQACKYLKDGLDKTHTLMSGGGSTETPARGSCVLTASNRSFTKATHLYAAIRLTQLERWQKQNTNLLDQYSTLTPLRKYWIKFRTERHFKN